MSPADDPAENLEAQSYSRYICSSLQRIMDCLDGLSADELNWRPPAPGANSLYVLAVHTLANAEENILGTLRGQAVMRDRATEFASVATSADSLREHWSGLERRLRSALARLPREDLDRERIHPRRGSLTGRDILIVTARHAAEHMGQAELTRDLLMAARSTARGSTP